LVVLAILQNNFNLLIVALKFCCVHNIPAKNTGHFLSRQTRIRINNYIYNSVSILKCHLLYQTTNFRK
jgi:hypothetical protein